MKNRALTIILCILLVDAAFGQTLIKGKVTDKQGTKRRVRIANQV